MSELKVGGTNVVWIETEEDPDGADRGGYQQVVHRLEIADGQITYSQTTDDEWVERQGEAPEVLFASQADVVRKLQSEAKRLEHEAQQLRALIPVYEAATGFHSILIEGDEDDYDDGDGEEDDVENDEDGDDEDGVED